MPTKKEPLKTMRNRVHIHILVNPAMSAAAIIIAAFLLILSGTHATARDKQPEKSVAGESEPLDVSALKKKYERPAGIPYPESNPYSATRYDLGQQLFFDVRLSDTGQFSCATCHQPSLAWSDGLPKSVGSRGKLRNRRTPTILNLAYADSFLWDGGATTLEEQVLRATAIDVTTRKARTIAGYAPLFEHAYPGEGITERTVAKALATFERRVVSTTAPFDRWVAGDENAISAGAKRGFVLFNDQGNCSTCHATWRFTNDSFHDIGLPGPDIGNGKLHKNITSLQHAFKTPTLRDVAQRDFFMHDGSLRTLRDVIEHYNRGGAVKRASLSHAISPLNLTEWDKADLIEFLNSLTGADSAVTLPALPR